MERLLQLRFMDVDRTRRPVHPRIQPRGVPAALQAHPVVDTLDVAEAREVTSRLLGRCQLTSSPRSDESFHCRLHAVQLLDVTMAYLDYAVESRVTVARSADCFTVHMTSAGPAVVHVDGDVHELTPFYALVISPGSEYSLELSARAPQIIVRIEREAMERQLARMLGRRLDEPIRFCSLGDLTSDAAARWHGALQLLSSEVLSPGSLIHQGYGAGSLEELVISSLLHVQESNYTERLHARPRVSGRVAVRRSIDYIETHLAEPISLTDIATHVQMSRRSIQTGFREDLDTTPIAFVRDRRLDAVRRLLLESGPGDGMTVTQAASRWGFTHLGSFSGVYRRRFGESPSATLRGVRSV